MKLQLFYTYLPDLPFLLSFLAPQCLILLITRGLYRGKLSYNATGPPNNQSISGNSLMKSNPSTTLAPDAATGCRYAIVGARFNEELADNLVRGAEETILRHGGADDDIAVIRVPGCYEIPVICQMLATSGEFDAIIATGVIIRGDTPHFDHLAANVTNALQNVSLATEIPIGFGVVMANTIEQAVDRASMKEGNKGVEAARAAIEMSGIIRSLRGDDG